MKISLTILSMWFFLYADAQQAVAADVYYLNAGKENGNFIFGRARFESTNGWSGELRHSYDEDQTFSAYAGHSFGSTGNFSWSVVPAAGVTIGQKKSAAVAVEGSVTVGGFNLWSQLQAAREWKSGVKSMYTWTEWTYQPLKWLYAGVTLQNTSMQHVSAAVDYGAVVGFSLGRFTLPVYALNTHRGELYFMTGCSFIWQRKEESKPQTQPIQF